MKHKKLRTVLTISVFFILVILGISGLPTQKVLTIYNRKNPSQKYYSRQAIKKGFVISYTHSVNKGRVHDYYSILEDGTLFVDRTVFVSYGAGIPEPEETEGAEFSVTPEGYTITNLQRCVPRLLMAVGIIANHSIVFNNTFNFTDNSEEELPLKNLFEPQTGIILETKRVSLIDYKLHKIN